jgi:hypothetical protein
MMCYFQSYNYAFEMFEPPNGLLRTRQSQLARVCRNGNAGRALVT